MKPTDLRDATWSTIRETLTGRLLDIYQAWVQHGPGTTRAVAARSHRDILSLRPRTTDLYHLGLLELIGSENGEGIYQARSQENWESWLSTQRPGVSAQLNFL